MTSKKVTNVFFGATCFLLLFFSNSVSAQLVNCGGHNANGTQQTACQIQDLVWLVQRIINFLLAWAWLVAIFFILWAGWEMINAGGNQEGITRGKDTLKHAIIGFFLIMAAYLLINVIVGLLTGQGVPGPGALENILNLIRPNP